MKGDPIPERDSVARYCDDGKVADGIPLVTAFELRAGEEYLSVNWLQYWTGIDKNTALDRIRRDVGRKLNLAEEGLFAVLEVGEIKKTIHAVISGHASVTHQPSKGNKSHSGIFGFGVSGFEVATSLANAVETDELFPAIVEG